MSLPNTETIECDLLIIGGGMSGCGAAFESKYWSGDMNVVMVEKAVHRHHRWVLPTKQSLPL